MNPNKITNEEVKFILHVQGYFITLTEYGTNLVNYIPQNTKYEVYRVKGLSARKPIFGVAQSDGLNSRGQLLTWTSWYAHPRDISKEFKTWLMVSGYSLDVESIK